MRGACQRAACSLGNLGRPFFGKQVSPSPYTLASLPSLPGQGFRCCLWVVSGINWIISQFAHCWEGFSFLGSAQLLLSHLIFRIQNSIVIAPRVPYSGRCFALEFFMGGRVSFKCTGRKQNSKKIFIFVQSAIFIQNAPNRFWNPAAPFWWNSASLQDEWI